MTTSIRPSRPSHSHPGGPCSTRALHRICLLPDRGRPLLAGRVRRGDREAIDAECAVQQEPHVDSKRSPPALAGRRLLVVELTWPGAARPTRDQVSTARTVHAVAAP